MRAGNARIVISLGKCEHLPISHVRLTATLLVFFRRHFWHFSGAISDIFPAPFLVFFRRHFWYFSGAISDIFPAPFRSQRRTHSDQKGGPVPGIAAGTVWSFLANHHRPKERDDTRYKARPQPRELTLNQEPNVARRTTSPPNGHFFVLKNHAFFGAGNSGCG